MRAQLLCLAVGAMLIAGCSKKPAEPAASEAAASAIPAAAPSAAAPSADPAPSGAPVSGTYTADGKPAALTQVVAYAGEPESGKPVTVLVFSAKDQAGDANAPEDALFNKFGDAVIAKIFPDGSVYSVDLVHSALDVPGGSAQLFGVVTLQDFKNAGGEISGHLTSGGPTDIHGQKADVDLTFHTKAP